MPLKVLPTDPRQLFPVSQALKQVVIDFDWSERTMDAAFRERAYAIAAEQMGKPHNCNKGMIINQHVAQLVVHNCDIASEFMQENV